MPSLLDQLQTDEVTALWVIYHDYCGLAHAKSVPPERFAAAIAAGIGFAKANMDFNVLDQQVPHPVFGAETGDFFAVPDPATYAPLPYHRGAARVYSFLTLRGGEPWAGCPRAALRAVIARYAAQGLRLQAAFEPECYLFTRDAGGFDASRPVAHVHGRRSGDTRCICWSAWPACFMPWA